MIGSSKKSPHGTRLARSLSTWLAAVVLTMLAIGGVSLFYTHEVFHGWEQLRHDDIHFMIVDDIEVLVGRVALGLFQRGRSAESFAARVRHLRAELERDLKKFEETHAGSDDPEERATIETLWRAHAALGELIQRQSTSEDPPQAGAVEEVERIIVMAHEAAERLRRSHRAVHMRHAEVARTRLNLLWALYAISVMLGCGFIVTMAFVARRRIVVPMQQISTTAMAIADGDLGARVPSPAADDEVARLSRAFNVMADRLQAREMEIRLAQEDRERQLEQIRVLYGIGVEVSRLRELSRTLDVITEKARELLKADAAALCLVADGGSCFTRRGMSGPPDAFPPAVPACCETSRAGSGPRTTCGGLHSAYRVAHLAAPLGKLEHPGGYLCVGMRSPRAFAPEEAHLLGALATLAEIAVEKAALYAEIEGLAAIQEREWIAREMHDGLAQTLGAVYLKLQQAQAGAHAAGPAVSDPLEDATTLIDRAYDDVRQCIFGLRTTPKLGLLPTLREYVRDFSLRTGIVVTVEVEGEPLHLSPKSEVQLIRIVQEALTNIQKHAKAEKASLRIGRRRGAFEVAVADVGCGFKSGPQRSGLRQYGLQVMRERAESVGGTLTVESCPGEGTRVVALIPEGR